MTVGTVSTICNPCHRLAMSRPLLRDRSGFNLIGRQQTTAILHMKFIFKILCDDMPVEQMDLPLGKIGIGW